MRLLHTSDWHLGQTLHTFDRGYEHQHFLDWLLDTVELMLVTAVESVQGLAEMPVRGVQQAHDTVLPSS